VATATPGTATLYMQTQTRYMHATKLDRNYSTANPGVETRPRNFFMSIVQCTILSHQDKALPMPRSLLKPPKILLLISVSG